MSNEKVVVFGGSGFIGTHLVRRLSSDRSIQVISVDIKPPRQELENVRYVQCDVRDLGGLEIDGPVASIYNLAAVHTTPGHPVHEYYETNIAGATEITAFARRHAVNDIVFTSSISVYGPSEDQKTEESIPDPQSAYGWSKWLAEKIHRAWLSEHDDRRLVIVRPAVVFGPGEGGNFTRLAKLLRWGLFIYPGRKDTIKGCIYVEDLIDAIFFAKSQERYALFNASYVDKYTIQDIVSTFKRLFFPNVKTLTVPYFALLSIAALSRPFAALQLGIHPERVLKLVRSTNIHPGWLQSKGRAQSGRLETAIIAWAAATEGKFD